MPKRRQPRYTPEQKEQALALVEELGSVKEAGEQLGISGQTLYRWRDQAEEANRAEEAGEPPPSELRAENRKLRAELRRLRMERDFLKKAAAFFAREDDSAASS